MITETLMTPFHPPKTHTKIKVYVMYATLTGYLVHSRVRPKYGM